MTQTVRVADRWSDPAGCRCRPATGLPLKSNSPSPTARHRYLGEPPAPRYAAAPGPWGVWLSLTGTYCLPVVRHLPVVVASAGEGKEDAGVTETRISSLFTQPGAAGAISTLAGSASGEAVKELLRAAALFSESIDRLQSPRWTTAEALGLTAWTLDFLSEPLISL